MHWFSTHPLNPNQPSDHIPRHYVLSPETEIYCAVVIWINRYETGGNME